MRRTGWGTGVGDGGEGKRRGGWTGGKTGKWQEGGQEVKEDRWGLQLGDIRDRVPAVKQEAQPPNPRPSPSSSSKPLPPNPKPLPPRQPFGNDHQGDDYGERVDEHPPSPLLFPATLASNPYPQTFTPSQTTSWK